MAIIKGTEGADTKVGTNLADLMYGNGGNDKLSGGLGTDTIRGGLGDDQIWGEQDIDLLYGEAGKDAMWGGESNDTLYGGSGNDSLYGDGGMDWLYGEAGADIVKGGLGQAFLDGGADNDSLYYDPLAAGQALVYGSQDIAGSVIDGGGGTDTAYIYSRGSASGSAALIDFWVQDDGKTHINFEKNGGLSDQFMEAGVLIGVEKVVLSGAGGARIQTGTYGEGPMTVTGTETTDSFFGGFGNETFNGGGGGDTFYGGGGSDTFNGGAGADAFVFDLSNGGNAKITGFQVGVDDLFFDHSLLTNETTQIVYGTAKTTFNLEDDMVVTVDAVIKAGDWHWLG